MKMLNYVYEVFATNEANNGTDVLNVGLPMFQSDVASGEKRLCPVALDFAALKDDYMAMTSDERAADNKEFRAVAVSFNDMACKLSEYCITNKSGLLVLVILSIMVEYAPSAIFLPIFLFLLFNS